MDESTEPNEYLNHSKYRTRCLGGSLLVLKGLNDCVTIERDRMSKPQIVRVEGEWTDDELDDAKEFWNGSEAQSR